jgi:hypothetical protein
MAVKVRTRDIPMRPPSIKLDLGTFFGKAAVSHGSVEGARLVLIFVVLAVLFLGRQLLFAVFGVIVILIVIAIVVGFLALAHGIGA